MSRQGLRAAFLPPTLSFMALPTLWGPPWPAAPVLPLLAAPALSRQLLSCTKFAVAFAKVAAFPHGALNVRQPNSLSLVS